MTDTVQDFIEHHGVKGQKWGIRNDRGHQGEREKTKKIAKLDKKFAKNASSMNTWVELHNRASDLTNKNDVSRINNKPQYKDQNFNRDSPLRQKYYKEHQDAFIDNLEIAAKEIGTNASGTKAYTIHETPDGNWVVDLTDVKHDDMASMIISVKYDADGYILSLTPIAPVTHSVEGFIAHHGVKGMKWGIRNKKNRVKKTSSDYKKTAALRKKKPHELSNKQLQSVNARVNLESNFKKLNPGTVEVGHNAVKAFLAFGATGVALHSLFNSAAGKAAIAAGKKFLTRP